MRKVLYIILFLSCITNTYGQVALQKYALLQGIEHRDSIMDKVGKKDLVDSLMKQIADYRKLTDLFKQEVGDFIVENQNLKEELLKYQILTSSDTLIFNQDLNMITDIPACLQERIVIINSIIELRTKIVAEEQYAQELENTLGNNPESYLTIREKIDKDIVGILSLIRKIQSMNLSLLSDEQQKYFRPGLTDRYNKFKKYY